MLRWLTEPRYALIEPAMAPEAALAAVPGRGAVRVLLSDHLVRYLTVRWDKGLRGPAEREAFLRHHFAAVYGARAADWVYASDERAGAADTRIAAAVDAALVARVRAIARAAGMALARVQPLAIEAFNRMRRGLGKSTALVIVREPGRATSIVVRDGGPRRVTSVRIADSGRDEIESLLRLEALEAGLQDAAAVVVHRAAWHGTQLELGTVAPLATPGEQSA